jgi:hypothetical protein
MASHPRTLSRVGNTTLYDEHVLVRSAIDTPPHPSYPPLPVPSKRSPLNCSWDLPSLGYDSRIHYARGWPAILLVTHAVYKSLTHGV